MSQLAKWRQFGEFKQRFIEHHKTEQGDTVLNEIVKTRLTYGPSRRTGREYCEELLEFLDHPEFEFKTIHVGGTNGKSSVSTKIARALTATWNAKVGLFTSPHILDIRERILINEAKLSCLEFAAAVEFISKMIEDIGLSDEDPPCFFHVLTLAALVIFADCKCEIVVLEVGVGGLLDSTTAVQQNVILSVITSIGLDHTSTLGSTRTKIAHHKAGIVRNNGVALIGPNGSELTEVWEEVIRQKTPIKLERMSDMSGLTFEEENVLIARRAVDLAIKPLGFKMDLEKNSIISQSLERPIRCRMQILNHQSECVDDRFKGYIIDVGHNEDAISKLWQSLQTIFLNKGAEEKVRVCFSYSSDRDLNMFACLTRGEHLRLSALRFYPADFHNPRLASREKYLKDLRMVENEELLKILEISDESSLIEEAHQARIRGEYLMILGSFYFAEYAIKHLDLNKHISDS